MSEPEDKLAQIVGQRADRIVQGLAADDVSAEDSQRMCAELSALSGWLIARLITTIKLELEGSPLFRDTH